jgi:hypothetical protein
MNERHTLTIDPSQPMIYQIRLRGHLGRQWTEWFGDVTITLEEGGEMLLTCPVADQAALYGLLRKVRDLVILSKPADAGKEKTWLRNSYPTNCGKR